ncbi:MAG TPA: DUF72 domain-containing protein [Candidatus Dormibacteraeota bacterium]|nr:DUF72 domain-containing protein [Candidatus Dormibacteraeota bacterium]
MTSTTSPLPTDMKGMGQLHMGCAGWSYKEWVGPLYEAGRSMLQQYAMVFDTVELNSSFYKPPDEGTILGLTKHTKRGFMFSAKINRKFTHDLAMKLDEDAVTELEDFVQLFDPLLTQDRLGCFLVQLPPSLKRDGELLGDFLAALPHRYDYVVEFRNRSWINPETWNILTRYQAAYCIVDEPLLPPDVHVTSDIGYIRWHGRGESPWYDYRYDQKQLQEWVPKVKTVRENTKKTFGIFNNHFHGYAPENCLQLMDMLGVASPKQLKRLKQVESRIERDLAGLPPTGTLDAYATTGH